MDKLIVTVAPTGNVPTKAQNPHLPATPAEIADTAYRCWKTGASIVHVHARDDQGRPTLDPDVFAHIYELISRRCDMIIQISTGGRAGMALEARAAAVRRLRPEMASLTTGSMNFPDRVYENPFSTIEYLARAMQEAILEAMSRVFAAWGEPIEEHRLRCAIWQWLSEEGLLAAKVIEEDFVLSLPFARDQVETVLSDGLARGTLSAMPRKKDERLWWMSSMGILEPVSDQVEQTVRDLLSKSSAWDRDSIFERVYRTSESVENPKDYLPQTSYQMPEGEVTIPHFYDTVKTLDQVEDVDYYIPGCPPQAPQIWAVIEAILSGDLPPKGSVVGASPNKTVCDECKHDRMEKRITKFYRPHEIIPDHEACLFDQGIICSGPATRAGCGALCTTVDLPCRGCYGPAPGVIDQGTALLSAVASVVDANTEEEAARIIGEVVDPAGTFYRFGLPASLLHRKKI